MESHSIVWKFKYELIEWASEGTLISHFSLKTPISCSPKIEMN